MFLRIEVPYLAHTEAQDELLVLVLRLVDPREARDLAAAVLLVQMNQTWLGYLGLMMIKLLDTEGAVLATRNNRNTIFDVDVGDLRVCMRLVP